MLNLDIVTLTSFVYQVPLEKEIYIAKDAAREAKIWGIHFGNLIDPCK